MRKPPGRDAETRCSSYSFRTTPTGKTDYPAYPVAGPMIAGKPWQEPESGST